ncbi:MAG TPA: lamin tail domain-containing protein [Bacteroidia bacterium]|nr:lamin tail domain-containing protein [Bacteroidia bacterium]
MRLFFSILFLFVLSNVLAQVNDNFTDGNINLSPTWTGDDSVFVVVPVSSNNQLRSNKTITNSSFYLSTPNALVNDCQWEFYANLQFNTSGANYVDVFLTSDNANLQASNSNGYFVRIGSTQDDICLYKRVAGTNTKIIDGIDGTTNVSNTTVKIKVIRTASNDWTLERDLTGTGNTYTTEGNVNDASITTSGFFGFSIVQSTASFFQKHFFDDIFVGPIVLDTTPPQLLSATAINANNVDVLFSEAVSILTCENVLNYNINNGINIGSATRDLSNSSLVHLVLSNNLVNNTNYNIVVNAIEDIATNVIAVGSNTNFSYIVPATAQFRDIIINEIYTDQTPLVGLPNAEFVEIYNRSSNSINLNGWKISDPSTNGTIGNFTLLPGQYLILCANADTALYQSFGNVKGVSSWPSLNNASDRLFLKTDVGTFIDSVNYYDTWYQDAIKATGGWALELINPNIASNCAGGGNWIASNHPSGGTPGQVNSVYNNSIDNTSPQISSSETPNANTLNICFSEPINPQLLIAANLSINNGIGPPANVTINGNCVTLNLSSPLQVGLNYTISCIGLSDCSGNALNPTTFNFIYFLPAPFDVVINEIMADPSPIVGLPDAEYVELYNTTNYNISTNGWTFEHGTTVRNFPNAVIPADSFLVLTTSAALTDLSIYGNVVSVPSLSSTAITNSGTTLSIKDNNGQLIHQVAYSDQWYNDISKAAGGWSLEMIDPTNPCAAGTNWTASTNTNGGTPGKTNAVYALNPDATAPNLGSVRIINAYQIEIEFTEPIVNYSSITAAMFSINNSINSPASISFNGTPANSVSLILSSPLQFNLIYTVTLNSLLSDCAGNNSTSTLSANFSNYNAKPFDIVINEIMADPEPSLGLPNYEYVELYNRTAFPINLAKWQLKYGGSFKSLPSSTINPGEYVILCASNANQALQVYGKTIVVPGLSSSSITNSGTTLVIADTLGNVIHAVDYLDTWYGNSNKANGGYSLEQIDMLNPCGGKSNWIASNSASGGTPGTINSVAASNPDNKSPEIKALCVESPNALRIKFNEPQDSTSLLNTATYFVNNAIGFPSGIQLFGPFYDQVILTFNTSFNNNTIYTININGSVKDCAGNVISSSASESFSLYQAQAYDLVINEILADETPVVGLPASEYVEIYNKTSYPINLMGYIIKTGSSNTIFGCASIQGGEYLTVLQNTANANDAIFGNNYVAENFSSLTNTGAEVTLSNAAGNIISSVTFSDQWYGNSDKAAGGWSLEQKDPLNPCAGSENWSASTSIAGGTPGQLNSINEPNPDTKAPEILRIAYLNPNNIVVYFSESLNENTIYNVINYTIDNGIGNPYYVIPYFPDLKKLGLNLQSPLQTGTIYTLTINGTLTDCVGNLINTVISGRFAIPQDIANGDIVLNELLFNPKTDGYDFVEFYNASAKVLSLNKVKIANVDTLSKTFSNLKTIDTLGYLIFPNEYYVVSENVEAVKSQYYSSNKNNFINVSSMPSMNVGDGSFGFILNNDTLIDALMYTENMHYPLIRDKKGVSLERISFARKSSDLSNWHSASEQVGFATPGYKNSQYMDDSQASDVISFANEIFSPDNDGYNDVLIVNYLFAEPGNVANASIYDARGRFITKIIENELLGTAGVFSWDGITESNEKANIGVYTIFFEYFDTKGNTKKIRKSFVLAGKL